MRFKKTVRIFLAVICWLPLLGDEANVTLNNGKHFVVKVNNGSPAPFKNDKIEIKNGGPVVAPAKDLSTPKAPPNKESRMFMVFGKFKADGKYKYTVSSPLDDSIVVVSEVTGPGQFYFQGIEASEFPAAWAWFNEPGDSWIPLAFRFENENPKDTFEFLQWIKIPEKSKQLMKTMITKINAEK